MGKFTDKVLDDLSEIKLEQKKMALELTVYNDQLKDHIRRTEILEERVMPIEDHVKFLRTLAKIIIPIAGLILGYLKLRS